MTSFLADYSADAAPVPTASPDLILPDASSVVESEPLDRPLIHATTHGFNISTGSTATGSVSVTWRHYLEWMCTDPELAQLPASHPVTYIRRFLQRTRATVAAMNVTPVPNAGYVNPVATVLSEEARLSSTPRSHSLPNGIYDIHRPLAFLDSANQLPAVLQTSPTSRLSSLVSSPQTVVRNATEVVFVWDKNADKLWRAGTPEAVACANDPDSRSIVFPPNSFVETVERDGFTRALPCSTTKYDGSNAWLKAQRCGPGCIYEAGFTGKRPVLIREHFARCHALAADHPLKVLCRLELDSHASRVRPHHLKRKRSSSAPESLESSPRTSGPAVPSPYVPSSLSDTLDPRLYSYLAPSEITHLLAILEEVGADGDGRLTLNS